MAIGIGGAGDRWPRARRRAWLVACLAAITVLPFLPTATADAAGPPVRIYVFAGQSNMVGYSTNSADLAAIDPKLAASPAVQFWGPTDDYATKWGVLKTPTEVSEPAAHSGFGPEISAGPMLAGRHRDATVAVVKLARGGTNLGVDWNPANHVGLERQLIGRVLSAKRQLESELGKRATIAGFFWMQGESDAILRRSAEKYERRLTDFIGAVRRDLRTPNMPFVIGRIVDLRRVTRTFRYSHIVRAAQENVDRKVPGTYLVSTDGLQRDPSSPIHFSSRGTVDVGRRFVGRSAGV